MLLSIHIADVRDSAVDHRQGGSQAALFRRLFGAPRELLPIFSRMQPAGFVVRMHGTVGPLPAFLSFALILESAFHARAPFLIAPSPNKPAGPWSSIENRGQSPWRRGRSRRRRRCRLARRSSGGGGGQRRGPFPGLPPRPLQFCQY